MYHDENAPSLTDYTLEEIIQDIQFDGLFDSYDDFDDVGDDDMRSIVMLSMRFPSLAIVVMTKFMTVIF